MELKSNIYSQLLGPIQKKQDGYAVYVVRIYSYSKKTENILKELSKLYDQIGDFKVVTNIEELNTMLSKTKVNTELRDLDPLLDITPRHDRMSVIWVDKCNNGHDQLVWDNFVHNYNTVAEKAIRL